MIKCKKCGFENADSAKFCTACRRPLSVATNDGADEKVTGQARTKLLRDMTDEEIFKKAMACKASGNAQQEEEAKTLLAELAVRGNAEGRYELADLYLTGKRPDRERGLWLLQLGAQEGHEMSRRRLELEMGGKVKNLVEPEVKINGESKSDFKELVKQAMPFVLAIHVTWVNPLKNQMAQTAGSGYIIKGGRVVTNQHVLDCNVAGFFPVRVTANFEPQIDPIPYELELLDVSEDADIAILKFKGLAEKKFAARGNLQFREDDLDYGEDVYTIGNPLNLGISVNSGKVACPHRKMQYGCWSDVVQLDFTINHGNSGGALLDMNNKIAGMTTFGPSDSRGGTDMCIPAKSIMCYLKRFSEEDKGEKK